jgi:hypothetical protein
MPVYMRRWLGPDGYTMMMMTVHRVGEKGGGGADVLWMASYPGDLPTREGTLTAQGDDLGDEYAQAQGHARAALLQDVQARVRRRFSPALAELVGATSTSGGSGWLYGPRQVFSVGPAEVRALARHGPTRVYLLGDAGGWVGRV